MISESTMYYIIDWRMKLKPFISVIYTIDPIFYRRVFVIDPNLLIEINNLSYDT